MKCRQEEQEEHRCAPRSLVRSASRLADAAAPDQCRWCRNYITALDMKVGFHYLSFRGQSRHLPTATIHFGRGGAGAGLRQPISRSTVDIGGSYVDRWSSTHCPSRPLCAATSAAGQPERSAMPSPQSSATHRAPSAKPRHAHTSSTEKGLGIHFCTRPLSMCSPSCGGSDADISTRSAHGCVALVR